MPCWDAQNVAEPHNGGAPQLEMPAELGAHLSITWALHRLRTPPRREHLWDSLRRSGGVPRRRAARAHAGNGSAACGAPVCWLSQALTGLLAEGLLLLLPCLPASWLLVPICQISLNTCTSCTQLHPNWAADVISLWLIPTRSSPDLRKDAAPTGASACGQRGLTCFIKILLGALFYLIPLPLPPSAVVTHPGLLHPSPGHVVFVCSR